ncbi:MAG: hypothetical protein RJA17_1469 [Pseudomonadota bacterium]|jgi:holo-[acyl-carrier protein] synthase
MIVGVGTDVVLTDRMRTLLSRWGGRLSDRILGPTERERFAAQQGSGAQPADRAVSYLAKRFAGKEAVGKALGCGLSRPMGLQRLELLNDARGAPVVVAHGELAEHLEREGLVVHVSLSDEQSMAQAFAVVEKR